MQDLRRLTVLIFSILAILQDIRGEIVSIASRTSNGSPAASRIPRGLNAWFI